MIVITAPTGNIGGRLLDLLLDETTTRSEELRVIVRDPAKLSDAARARVDVVTGSHGDADVVDRAFAGADAVFWLVPPDPEAPNLDTMYSEFTHAAAKAFTTLPAASAAHSHRVTST
ncbi:NAD(P)H-binding protein [Nocardia amamiensis]|uniref:NAD(P)H-binding protein n=1 Tax=Nocardia amamiensis TaxID=404578 RepID=UPI00082EC1D2|nr:NAD(P)H-binding protein [Nocardia amamiensis]